MRFAWPSASRAIVPNQYANDANPRAHYEGTGAEIAEALPRVDVLVAGLGTGGTLMGAGERLRESFPDVVVAAAEPLQGDLVYGLRSLADGYVLPILDVSKLDRKILVSNEESVEALRLLLDREGIFAGVSSEPCCTSRASSPKSPRTPYRHGARGRRLEVPFGRLLDKGGRRGRPRHGRPHLVQIPPRRVRRSSSTPRRRDRTRPAA